MTDHSKYKNAIVIDKCKNTILGNIKLNKALIGLATSTIVMFVAYGIMYALDIDANKVSFLVGWASCMGYYISTDAFEKSRS